MSMTLDDLKELFEKQGVTYFVAPDPARPAILATFQGVNGAYQVITHLEVDGTFVQLRTINWLHCPAGHKAVGEVLKAVGDENYQRRLVKIGWDPTDGELVAYADVWVEDGKLTQQQFSRMLSVYLPVMDMAYGRLKKTIDTGHDPGMLSVEDAIRGYLEGAGGGGGSGLPDKVRKFLDEMHKSGKTPDGPGKREPEREPDAYV
jgi:Putative bacterial sensory transduction regulator